MTSFLRWAGSSESKLMVWGVNSAAWGERVEFSARRTALGSNVAARGERLEAMTVAAVSAVWTDFLLSHLASFASLDRLCGISEKANQKCPCWQWGQQSTAALLLVTNNRECETMFSWNQRSFWLVFPSLWTPWGREWFSLLCWRGPAFSAYAVSLWTSESPTYLRNNFLTFNKLNSTASN